MPRSKLRKDCKTCRHHISLHQYRPDQDRSTGLGPRDCRGEGCDCKLFVRPARGEIVTQKIHLLLGEPMQVRGCGSEVGLETRDTTVITCKRCLVRLYKMGPEDIARLLREGGIITEDTRREAADKARRDSGYYAELGEKFWALADELDSGRKE